MMFTHAYIDPGRSGVSSCWLKKSKRKISCLKCDVAIKKLRIRQDLYRLQVEKQANKTVSVPLFFII